MNGCLLTETVVPCPGVILDCGVSAGALLTADGGTSHLVVSHTTLGAYLFTIQQGLVLSRGTSNWEEEQGIICIN